MTEEQLRRAMGNPLLGGKSLTERFNAHIAENMRRDREAIERRQAGENTHDEWRKLNDR